MDLIIADLKEILDKCPGLGRRNAEKIIDFAAKCPIITVGERTHVTGLPQYCILRYDTYIVCHMLILSGNSLYIIDFLPEDLHIRYFRADPFGSHIKTNMIHYHGYAKLRSAKLSKLHTILGIGNLGKNYAISRRCGPTWSREIRGDSLEKCGDLPMIPIEIAGAILHRILLSSLKIGKKIYNEKVILGISSNDYPGIYREISYNLLIAANRAAIIGILREKCRRFADISWNFAEN